MPVGTVRGMGCSVGRLGTSSGVSSFREKHSKATVPCSGGRAIVARGGDSVLLHAARRGRWGGGGERELSDLGGVGGMTWYWYTERELSDLGGDGG